MKALGMALEAMNQNAINADEWRERYYLAEGRRAMNELALQGANRGIRRLKAKLDRLENFLNGHQLWVEYRKALEQADAGRRYNQKLKWQTTKPTNG